MSARRNPTPSYLHHKQSGRARAVWTDTIGLRQQKLLPGEYDSPESRTAFARLQLELETTPHRLPDTAGAEVSVNEVLLAYLEFADGYYRTPDGRPTNEIVELRQSARPVREVYGLTPAAEFGPKKLAAVRQQMIDKGLCRTLINRRIDRVRRVFKWASAEELVPVAVYQSLRTLAGLRRGRSEVRESEPVTPVDNATVDATLPYLNRHVRGLVLFQRFSGCRPGEACLLRRCDLDTSGVVWLYKPSHHKTAHRGKRRTIAVGPQAQAVLAGFFTDDASAYLFSPRLAVAEMRAEKNASRKTKLYSSQIARDARNRKVEPKRRPAERYSVGAYGYAIRKAVDRANRQGRYNPAFGPALPPVPAWAPNMIRHTFATQVRDEHGLEAAQVLLGHSRADVTQVYAERNEKLAVSVAAMIG